MNPLSNEEVPLGTLAGDRGIQPDKMEESKPKGYYLPEGSSRQVVRRELFRRAMIGVSDKFTNPRWERRALARTIAKDLWKRGERLVAASE